jgi:hypothetical protein
MAGSQACSKAAAPVGANGTCALTTDCAEGLQCITQPDGSRQCSSCLMCIESTEESGADAPAVMMGDDATPPDDAAAPPDDTGAAAPDTGSPPADTGSPPPDTGSPPVEAGGD